MVTSFQYPHFLQVKDDNGNWEDFSICRDQPNDKGKMVTVGDGINYQFSSLIFMPTGVQDLLVGQDIRIQDVSREVRLETEVRRFSQDNLHCRLWV